jgi:hypothetical protein
LVDHVPENGRFRRRTSIRGDRTGEGFESSIS